MAQAMILRRGGGNAGLNVRAYSTAVSLPAIAANNEIGIITTTTLNKVYAQAEIPASPTAGDVWMKLS